jgi:NAD(P)-dependent dehydrogenase (short-subunit alcohol dehydrogenase family)
MDDKAHWAGKVVLVTGGTKGVGRGIALAFLQAGATVLICGRNEPEQPVEQAGRVVEFIAANLKETGAAATLIAAVIERYGRIDVLVNNAGGAPFAMAAEASPRFHEAIIQLNLLAPLHLAQEANRHMQQQVGGGVILFIGSVSALRPSPGTAAYGAAKAGVLSLVQSLAVEWAPRVRLAAVSPGPVLTEQAGMHFGDEEGVAAVADTIPLGRLATPDDIGAACVFLASPSGAYASGTNLVLHGGGERPAFLAAANAEHG